MPGFCKEQKQILRSADPNAQQRIGAPSRSAQDDISLRNGAVDCEKSHPCRDEAVWGLGHPVFVSIAIPGPKGGTWGIQFIAGLAPVRKMRRGLVAATWVLFVGQGFYAGEFFAFEEFEAGAAAGGDVGDLVGIRRPG